MYPSESLPDLQLITPFCNCFGIGLWIFKPLFNNLFPHITFITGSLPIKLSETLGLWVVHVVSGYRSKPGKCDLFRPVGCLVWFSDSNLN